MKKKYWTDEQSNLLYDCWKEDPDINKLITSFSKTFSFIPAPEILKKIRNLSKNDPKWIRWKSRKKNEKEKIKLVKKQEIEKKKQERLEKRKIREERKILKDKKSKEKQRKDYISQNLSENLQKEISIKIPPEFFFCGDIQQYANNNSCIFRAFVENYPKSPECLKCKRMDKYIAVVEEIIEDAKQRKKVGRHPPSKKVKNKPKKS